MTEEIYRYEILNGVAREIKIIIDTDYDILNAKDFRPFMDSFSVNCPYCNELLCDREILDEEYGKCKIIFPNSGYFRHIKCDKIFKLSPYDGA